MSEDKNLDENQEETPKGDQPAEGGDKKPDKKEVEETGTKPSDPDKTKKEGDGDDDDFVKVPKKDYKNYEKFKKHNSRSADKRTKKAKRSEDRGGSRFSFEEPVAPDTSEEEVDYQDRNEFVKLKQGVADLVLDNEDILKVVKSDPTLKRILKNNPLALLDSVPIDAEDALEQITDYLDEIVSSNTDDGVDKKGDKEKKEGETTPAPQEPLEKDKKKKDDEKISTAQGMQKVEEGLSKRFEKAGL